jgi:hypothetical protein
VTTTDWLFLALSVFAGVFVTAVLAWSERCPWFWR